jgi:hypothetical protein
LPVPIPDGEFRFGVWIETDRATFIEVYEAWNDAEKYMGLAFEGTLANRVAVPEGEVLAERVHLVTRTPNGRPFVAAAESAELDVLLRTGWDAETYHRFASS